MRLSDTTSCVEVVLYVRVSHCKQTAAAMLPTTDKAGTVLQSGAGRVLCDHNATEYDHPPIDCASCYGCCGCGYFNHFISLISDEQQKARVTQHGLNKSLCLHFELSALLCCRVLQVKNFGRRGRTKHTHLVDQDTTVFDDDLAPERALQDAYFKRVAGVSQNFVKPKTLPINEKRHITSKDKRTTEAASSRAAYLKSNY